MSDCDNVVPFVVGPRPWYAASLCFPSPSSDMCCNVLFLALCESATVEGDRIGALWVCVGGCCCCFRVCPFRGALGSVFSVLAVSLLIYIVMWSGVDGFVSGHRVSTSSRMKRSMRKRGSIAK